MFVLCIVKAEAQSRTIKTTKQVRKKNKERTREGIQGGKKIVECKEIFLSSITVQTGSGVHPASCWMRTDAVVPKVSRPGRDAGY
jgi:hypothetical protein